jgi:hypothetical protein
MGGVYKDRQAVVVFWEKGDYEGPVKLRTSNENDVSGTNLDANQGYAALTYPLDFTGTTHVEVLTEAGELLDEFDIDV